MMRRPMLIAAVLAFGLGACGGGGTTPSTPTTADRAKAIGAMAKDIRANPGAAETILADHGSTADAFEDALYAIAKHDAMTKAYLAAYP